LVFVAQLDLAAIPEITGLDLPRSGALYFFYHMLQPTRNRKARIGRNPATGEVIKVPARKVAKSRVAKAAESSKRRNFRVLYSAGRLANLPLCGFPNELEDEYRYQGVRFEAGTAELSMPFPNDPVLSPLCLTRDEQEQYLSFVRQLMESRERFRGRAGSDTGEHAVGGYPDYIQPPDPRLRAELITTGLYPRVQGRGRNPATGESISSKEDEPLLEKAEAAMQDWQSLFVVDSEQSADILWGDMGRLYYLIRKDDLQKRAFENVWIEFDCY
jgi:nucleoid DNA-binding protein